METTFISIHDLSLDARLLYVSSSIVDILGYLPHEVVGKSCWEYFHPDEIPFARVIHGRGVRLDKAAVLNYCRIKNRDGRWVGCECVFTIVHDVLVASTSIYRRGTKSELRAYNAPVVSRLFLSSPRDPRYHMLQYLSHKFSQELPPHLHEPRAALFLNRFTRTLTIMYATNGLVDVLGISADELCGKSFYYCIQGNCLQEAVRCLESAKANDSIAYLRFWFRDPRQDDQEDNDQHMGDTNSSGDEDDGGVHVDDRADEYGTDMILNDETAITRSSSQMDQEAMILPDQGIMAPNSRSSSGIGTDMDGQGNDPVFDQPTASQSSSSSLAMSVSDERQRPFGEQRFPAPYEIEVEAVVSCTSDGLVVILRRARPFFPQINQPAPQPLEHPYVNGLFASPWAIAPILPDSQNRPMYDLPPWIHARQAPTHPTAAQAHTAANIGPVSEVFMKTIREVGVFAWALTGINGHLAQYGRGKPADESQPPGGLPIWASDSTMSLTSGSVSGYDRQSGWKSDYRNENEKPEYPDQNGGHQRFNHGAYEDRARIYSNNGNNLTADGVAGNGTFHARMPGTNDETSWIYGVRPELKPWDQVYMNRHNAYEIGHDNEARELRR